MIKRLTVPLVAIIITVVPMGFGLYLLGFALERHGQLVLPVHEAQVEAVRVEEAVCGKKKDAPRFHLMLAVPDRSGAGLEVFSTCDAPPASGRFQVIRDPATGILKTPPTTWEVAALLVIGSLMLLGGPAGAYFYRSRRPGRLAGRDGGQPFAPTHFWQAERGDHLWGLRIEAEGVRVGVDGMTYAFFPFDATERLVLKEAGRNGVGWREIILQARGQPSIAVGERLFDAETGRACYSPTFDEHYRLLRQALESRAGVVAFARLREEWAVLLVATGCILGLSGLVALAQAALAADPRVGLGGGVLLVLTALHPLLWRRLVWQGRDARFSIEHRNA